MTNNKFECSAISRGVEIELTNHCAQNCKTCERKKIKELGFMNFETFVRVIAFIKQGNYQEIMLSGLGDIFLHKKLFKMIDRLFKKFPNINIVIPTKGQSITLANLKKIKLLQNKGLSIIPSFSIYSFDNKKYKSLTGGDLNNFKKIIKRTQKLKLNYTFEFLIMSYSINELEKFKSFAKSLGINNYGYSLVHNWNGSMSEKKHKKFFSKDISKFFNKRPKNEICEAFKSAYVFIDFSGNIQLCSIACIEKTHILGNARHDSLKTILKRKNKLNYKKICNNCFYYKYKNRNSQM